MNLLAHLLLADLTGHCPIATLKGDFIKGRLEGKYQGRELAALRLHRQVDSFTDQHPITAQSRNLLDPEFRRYAGILTDVFYDHFLVHHWAHYADRPLQQFADEVYQILRQHKQQSLPELQMLTQRIAQSNLLVRYGEEEIISQVLARMSTRLRRANPLALAGNQLTKHRDQLEKHFQEFFPLLLEQAFLLTQKAPGDKSRQV